MSELPWISPARVSKMLVHDKSVNSSRFGFATYHNNASRSDNKVSTLARAKLQPQKPTTDRDHPAGYWPVTAAAERLVLARGVPGKPDAFEKIFEDYDAHVKPKQDLLAAVLTMHFQHGNTLGDILSLVANYCWEMLAIKRQLTSLIALHNPADGLSDRLPHAHCIVLSRRHRVSGWAEIEADLHASNAARIFEDEWASYQEVWGPKLQC